MSEEKLTKEQAFLAMYAFLDDYYQVTQSDDIGGLLGSMSLLEDGGTADPSVQSEWLGAVEKAVTGGVHANLVLKK